MGDICLFWDRPCEKFEATWAPKERTGTMGLPKIYENVGMKMVQ